MTVCWTGEEPKPPELWGVAETRKRRFLSGFAKIAESADHIAQLAFGGLGK
jgi:hypothetical protein